MQEDRPRGQPGSPRGSLGPEAELAGSGTYMRFDVPRPKIKRSWPSFRGGWRARGRAVAGGRSRVGLWGRRSDLQPGVSGGRVIHLSLRPKIRGHLSVLLLVSLGDAVPG